MNRTCHDFAGAKPLSRLLSLYFTNGVPARGTPSGGIYLTAIADLLLVLVLTNVQIQGCAVLTALVLFWRGVLDFSAVNIQQQEEVVMERN